MTRTFRITKSAIPQWGYEITGGGYHNIAPDQETAIRMIRDRYGYGVDIRIGKDPEIKRTDRKVQITQTLCGQTERIVRRIWFNTETNEEVVKVCGGWVPLYAYYRSSHHEVDTWYEPVERRRG